MYSWMANHFNLLKGVGASAIKKKKKKISRFIKEFIIMNDVTNNPIIYIHYR